MAAAVAELDDWLACVEISDAKVVEANWLEALEVCAVVAEGVELAVLGRFCPVNAERPPWAAVTTDCSPDNIEVAEIAGIVTVGTPGSPAGTPAETAPRPARPAPRTEGRCKP